jgi:hypothetical protein
MKVSQLNSHAFRSMALHSHLAVSNVVVRTLFGYHILEVGGKIPGMVPLEQIVELDRDGVVCSVCVSHKTKLSDSVQVNLTSQLSE